MLGPMRTRFGAAGLIFAGTVVLGVALAGLGISTSQFLAFVALFTVGLGWLAVLATLNTATQFAVPAQHRASGFAHTW